MSALDRFYLVELHSYFEDEFLIDLLTFVTYPNFLWDWVHMWPLLGLPQGEAFEREEVDRKRLHVMGLKQVHDPYRHMLAQFLTNHERAGKYVITKDHYTRVAMKVAKYLFEPKKP